MALFDQPNLPPVPPKPPAVPPPPPAPAPVAPLAPRQALPPAPSAPVAPRPGVPLMPPASAIPKAPEPVDIFSGVGSTKNLPPLPGAPEGAAIAESPAKGFVRKMLRLLVYGGGAALVVGAGIYAYGYFLGTKPASLPLANSPAPNAPENVNVLPASVPENVPGAFPETPPAALLPQDDPNSTVDTDVDGLTDYQEAHLYSTNPSNPDTDGDGLSDRDEVINWNTNPINPDSDGDGYGDGKEVQSGYNPLGPGKLPKALK